MNLVNLSQENSFRLSLNFLHQTSLGVNTATTERVPTTKKPFIYRLNVLQSKSCLNESDLYLRGSVSQLFLMNCTNSVLFLKFCFGTTFLTGLSFFARSFVMREYEIY